MRFLAIILTLATAAAAQTEVSLDQFGGDLRAAIAAVQAPGRVLIPAGEWPQPFGAVELPTDISLQGAGARLSRLVFPGPGLVLPDGSRRQEIRSLALLGPIEWSAPERSGLHLVRSVRSVVLRDVWIRGWDYGLRVTHSWSVVCDHVVLNNHAVAAVKVEGGVNCLSLRDCEIGLTQVGVVVDDATNCLLLDGGRIEAVARGVSLGPQSHGTVIRSVYFENLSEYAVRAESPSLKLEGCMLNGYYAQGPVAPALIRLEGAGKQRRSLRMTGCRLRNANIGVLVCGRWKILGLRENEWESTLTRRIAKAKAR